MATSGSTHKEEPFLLQLSRAKYELIEKIKTADESVAERLEERVKELLSEFKRLEDEYNSKDVTDEIDKLNTEKAEIRYKDVKTKHPPIQKELATIDLRINELGLMLNKTRAKFRRVEFEWDELPLENVLCKIGLILVSAVPNYIIKSAPELYGGTHSFNSSPYSQEFRYPRSIAINSETNNIYICDFGNNRVQVYNESLEFVRYICDMKGPAGICTQLNKVYVTQAEANTLNVYHTDGTFSHTVGGKGNQQLEFNDPRGIVVSVEKDLIYICEWQNNRIQCLNLQDYSFKSFINDVDHPKDVKLTSQKVVVLMEGDTCIRFYNYSHELIGNIITYGEDNQVVLSSHFCIDLDSNILMTDYSEHCVLIFSNSGKLIHEIGEHGEGRGEFIEPKGIAIDRKGRIIVVSCNSDQCIQIF